MTALFAVPLLAHAEDPAHVAPFGTMVAGIGEALPDVVEVHMTGDGVPYRRYGSTFRDRPGGINRPAFTSDLVDEWLPGRAARRAWANGCVSSPADASAGGDHGPFDVVLLPETLNDFGDPGAGTGWHQGA